MGTWGRKIETKRGICNVPEKQSEQLHRILCLYAAPVVLSRWLASLSGKLQHEWSPPQVAAALQDRCWQLATSRPRQANGGASWLLWPLRLLQPEFCSGLLGLLTYHN